MLIRSISGQVKDCILFRQDLGKARIIQFLYKFLMEVLINYLLEIIIYFTQLPIRLCIKKPVSDGRKSTRNLETETGLLTIVVVWLSIQKIDFGLPVRRALVCIPILNGSFMKGKMVYPTTILPKWPPEKMEMSGSGHIKVSSISMAKPGNTARVNAGYQMIM